MRKFTRLPEPDYLAAKWDEWGQDWERRRALNSKATWHWHQVDLITIDLRLRDPLKGQTQGHCSFCDAFPVSPPSDDTIEHFRPKAQFPREAYQWSNLYYCCRFCQRKGCDFSDLALRPDAADYEFDRYFMWDYTTGEIEANPQASTTDQERAVFSIEYFRLNEEHPAIRRQWQHWFAGHTAEELEKMPYRHFLGS